jgi:transcriptional regulator with XRE-family HTH domain
LARDNLNKLCCSCRARASEALAKPPTVPGEFWQTDRLRDALDAWHMGRVIQAYRLHPWHGRPLSQEVVAAWVGLTQTQLSRLENGPPLHDLSKLIQWARVLRIPPRLLWFTMPSTARAAAAPVYEHAEREPAAEPVNSGTECERLDDMKRREVLRLMSMTGSLLAVAPMDGQFDWQGLDYAAEHPGRLDSATLDGYDQLNAHLWRAFSSSKAKSHVFPMVRQQLQVLNNALEETHGPATRQRLCALAGDLFQLAGEVFFDGDHYVEAAHCYTLAATASKEAEAFDLWACALTRHAFIGVYERQFAAASPLLDLASRLARRGDRALSTRHWVAAVRAQTLAGLGELDACQRSLDAAQQVEQLSGQVHTSGWLRFDSSRLPEERGACYVELRRPELAEPALTEAMRIDISMRRRGSVLTDIALVGAQRRDLDHLVSYASAALDAARQTGSAVVVRKLKTLQGELAAFRDDSHVRHLDEQITTLTRVTPN